MNKESATLRGHTSFSVLRKKQVLVGWKLLNLLRNGYLELRHELCISRRY